MKVKTNSKKETFIVIASVVVFFVLSITLIFICGKGNEVSKSVNNEGYQTNLSIPGYEFDKPFDMETYDYNVEVDMDEIQILCDSINSISGCNQKINMSNKEVYDHIIEIDNNGEIKKYTIHIKKTIKNKDNKIRITSIDGIPNEWTNKEIEIKVNVEIQDSTSLKYSFDNGKHWQDSNIIKVEENKKLDIIVKDDKGNKTQPKQIIINKIDKDKPKADIIIESKNKDKIVIKAIGSDKTSEVDKYSFDGNIYSIVSTKEITKPGTYKVKVKDKAGNESEEQNIKITEKDFPKEDVKESEYKIELESNGATINSSVLKCKSYEETCKITLPKITRSGGVVIGWSKDKDSKKADYKSGEIISIKKNIKLYAITSKTLKATFEKNGVDSIGSSSKTCKIYNTEKSCSITTPTITRSGWLVEGWNKSKTSTSVSVKQKASLSITRDEIYYAITSKTLKATFEKNGVDSIGSSSKTCKIYNTGKSCSIITPTITRSGWAAEGWNKSKTSTSVSVKPSASLSITGNETYYAITSKTLKATFEQNGADSIGIKSKTCKIYNTEKSCNITMPTITRSEGVVVGWNTTANAKTSSHAQNLQVILSGDKKYYAITYENYVAYFEQNGADSIGSTSKKCKVYNKEGSCSITMPTITRSGGTVIGWNTLANTTSTSTSIKPGETLVLIFPKITYYAITKKVNKLTIKNGDTTIKTLSCNEDNSTGSCNVYFNESPFTEISNLTCLYESGSKKYIIKDFTESKGGKVYLKATNSDRLQIKLTGNKTLYVNLIPISNVFTNKNKKIYVENGFYNTAKTRINDICSWEPYLCNVEGNIFVFSEANFKYRWSQIPGAVGMTYGSVPSKVDVIGTLGVSGSSYSAWIHEMSHAWDSYYESKIGTKISSQSDFQKLYKYYKKNNGNNEDLSSTEFFAAMLPTYVFFKNNLDGSKYNFDYFYWKQFVNSTTETKLKKYMTCVFEKYIKISNNNYNKNTTVTGCSFPY